MQARLLTVFLLLFTVISFTPMVFAAKPNNTPNKHKVVNNKDNEIVAFLVILDKNEIAAANVAKQKKLESAVTDYAHMMVKEHTQNLNQTIKIAKHMRVKPTDTDAVEDLKAEGKEQLTTLKPLNGKEFESAYMNAMVQDHTDALDLIDNQLLPTVSNDKLKKHLLATRKHVAKHLQKAKQVQAEI